MRSRNEEICINKPNNFLIRMKIKMFMLAALAAFATLAGCSDDENKTTGGGGTINPPVKPSEYEATFKSTSYYSTTVTIKAITENAKSQYFMAVVFETAFLEQQIPGITDNDIAKGVINYYRAEYMSQGATVADIYNVLTQQGRLHGSVTPLELDVPGLSAGTSYSVVVAGVNENLEIVANGIVAEFTTKTLPGLEEENCTFEWTVEPKSTSVTMSFTPSDKEVPYFFYALTAEEYSSECQNDPAILKELLPSFIANLAKAYQMSVSEFMEKQRMTGDWEEFTLTGLLPKTGYVVFVCGMDEYGRPTTDVSVKDFETLEYVASDATVESVDVRLYDGEEASSIDPTTYKPDDYGGAYFLRYVPQFSEECAEVWNMLVIDADFSGESDDVVLSYIMSMGFDANTSMMDIVKLPEGLMVYAYIVAQNEAGEYGNIYRCEPFEVSKANLSPVEELFPESNSKSGISSVAFSSVGKMCPKTVNSMKIVSVL